MAGGTRSKTSHMAGGTRSKTSHKNDNETEVDGFSNLKGSSRS